MALEISSLAVGLLLLLICASFIAEKKAADGTIKRASIKKLQSTDMETKKTRHK